MGSKRPQHCPRWIPSPWATRGKDANRGGGTLEAAPGRLNKQRGRPEGVLENQLPFTIIRLQRPCGVMEKSPRFGAQRPEQKCALENCLDLSELWFSTYNKEMESTVYLGAFSSAW